MNNAQNIIDTSAETTHISSHREEICALREEVITLKRIVQSQAERIQWFEKQLFGSKSLMLRSQNPNLLSCADEKSRPRTLH